MKRYLILGIFSFWFICLLSCSGCRKDQFVPDYPANAIIFSNTDSPYYIYQDLKIPQDSMMIVEAGVEIFLDTNVYINSFGDVLLQGQEDLKIYFKPIQPHLGWGQLKIKQEAQKFEAEHVVFIDGTLACNDNDATMRHVDFLNTQSLNWEWALARFWNGSLLVEHCNFSGNGTAEGVLVHNTANPVVRNCTFNDVPDAVEFIGSIGGVISDCTITGGTDDGIDLNACMGTVVSNNVIKDVQDRGMEIGSEQFGISADIQVRRNIITGAKEGINVKENSTAFVINNTLCFNDIAFTLNSLDGSGSSILAENTILYENNIDVVKDELSVITFSYCCNNKQAIQGTGCFFGDPKITDAANNDFSLKSDSPCIDAGNPDSPKDEDGSNVDIGALTFQ